MTITIRDRLCNANGPFYGLLTVHEVFFSGFAHFARSEPLSGLTD